MMKNIILFLSLFIAHNAFAQNNFVSKTLMPKFKFKDLTGKEYTQAHLPSTYDFITIVYYDPGCEHCEDQANRIKQELSRFSKTYFIWVTIGDAGQALIFKNYYFARSKNIKFLTDPTNSIFYTFAGIQETPTIWVYNKKKELIATIPGPVDANIVYQYYH